MLSDVISDAVSDLREGMEHYTKTFPTLYSAERIKEITMVIDKLEDLRKSIDSSSEELLIS